MMPYIKQKETSNMEKEQLQERIEELTHGIIDLCDDYTDIPPYEVGFRLIAQATNLLLFCAPNHLVAIKTIMASIEIGVAEYQEQNKES